MRINNLIILEKIKEINLEDKIKDLEFRIKKLEIENKNYVECEICKRLFKTPQALRGHKQFKHGVFKGDKN